MRRTARGRRHRISAPLSASSMERVPCEHSGFRSGGICHASTERIATAFVVAVPAFGSDAVEVVRLGCSLRTSTWFCGGSELGINRLVTVPKKKMPDHLLATHRPHTVGILSGDKLVDSASVISISFDFVLFLQV